MKTFKCLVAVLLGGVIAALGCCVPCGGESKQNQGTKSTAKEGDTSTAPKKGEQLPIRKPILE
jgi:hypothetical protein